jgi:hypothetical protein
MFMNPEKELFGKVVEKCTGCERVTSAGCCEVYFMPERQHSRIGGCAMRTNNLRGIVSDDKKLNPLKASKRGVKQ